jgi:hypothetical protein
MRTAQAAQTRGEGPNSWPRGQGHGLAIPPRIERSWTPDQTAMVAALRVVLGLPRQLPDRGLGGMR